VKVRGAVCGQEVATNVSVIQVDTLALFHYRCQPIFCAD